MLKSLFLTASVCLAFQTSYIWLNRLLKINVSYTGWSYFISVTELIWYSTWKLWFWCSCVVLKTSKAHIGSHVQTHKGLSSNYCSNTSSCIESQCQIQGFSIDHCQNIKWIIQCGSGGAVRSALQSQHLTGFYSLPCKSDTCLICYPQLKDPT